MAQPPQLRTKRLRLRGWQESDLPLFAQLNADPEVMRHLEGPRSRESSDAAVATFRKGWERNGWGLWAVDVVGTDAFIGFVGLAEATFDAPFTPAVEVGWRLARSAWGFGYATEAARAALIFGFNKAKLGEIVSFTAAINHRSRAVMERIGLQHDPAGDFDHPSVPAASELRRHVLYRFSPAGRMQYLRCPCGSGETYGDCCGRFHQGLGEPATALLLMRARYSAFAVANADFLRDTWDRQTRPADISPDRAITWTRLEIVDTAGGGPFDTAGFVEFRAYYTSPRGSGQRHERSRFVKRASSWTYVDGVTFAD